MSDTSIKVDGLGKKYRIRHNRPKHYTALRDVITEKVRGVFRPRQLSSSRATVEDFWALRGVSFEVKRGEILGIIGHNGAGKSTLLKLISRITEPTEGRIEIEGRVASMLEVGTGFHPELTGRENIFLSGIILGMRNAEIKRRFDEIVAFADVEKFLDTPVKRFSSGMYLRLAFAVAAHLEPEILIVDEVLSYGDAEFQKKCLGKMGDVATKEGRTVLFVSHNMAAVTGLCGRALWLEKGAVIATGEAEKVVRDYLAKSLGADHSARSIKRIVGEDVSIEGAQLIVDGYPSSNVQAGQSCLIRIHYRILPNRSAKSLSCSLTLFTEGQKLTNLWTNCHNNLEFISGSGSLPKEGFLNCFIDKWPFRNQTIRVDIYSHIGHVTQDFIEEALVFSSHDGDFYGSGIITDDNQGMIFLDHSWSLSATESHLTKHGLVARVRK
jgi:lipopolysaccharide transport system ATP-binding protein